jgi:hypothetical protein
MALGGRRHDEVHDARDAIEIGVEVQADAVVVLILAVTEAVDALAHD